MTTVDLNPGSTFKVLLMTTTTTPHPNHHAHYPRLSGLGGLVAGLTMVFGRGDVARWAADLAKVGPGQHVVDVGCGPGAAVREAARRGAAVTGVDPAPVMLRLARSLTWGRRRITWIDGAAEALPVADGTADVLWSIATVHHWPDVEAGLSEARRLLVEGGTFLAAERRTRPGAKGLASHGWTDDQAEVFAEMCRAAGFDPVEVTTQRTGRSTLLAVTAVKGT
jgi:SAM-dependent methyltransferase